MAAAGDVRRQSNELAHGSAQSMPEWLGPSVSAKG